MEISTDSKDSEAKILYCQIYSGATRNVHLSQLQARSEDNYWQDDPSHQVPRQLETSLPSKSIQNDSPNKDTVYATQSSDDCTVSSGEDHDCDDYDDSTVSSQEDDVSVKVQLPRGRQRTTKGKAPERLGDWT